MKKFIIAILLMLPFVVHAESDTLYVSHLYTTHVRFSTDIIYANVSNPTSVVAKVIDQSKDLLALKARDVFAEPLNISVLEANGNLHTFILSYVEQPDKLIVDVRPSENKAVSESVVPASASFDKKKSSSKKTASSKVSQATDNTARKANAPQLKDVITLPQQVFHIGHKQYDIRVLCENVIAYSDITYMVFKLENQSGVSYECEDAVFVIESKKSNKRSVVYDKNVTYKSRYGSLSAAPGEDTMIAYSLDKMSLSKDQVLKVYFYENRGQRELVLTFTHDDINKARLYNEK